MTWNYLKREPQLRSNLIRLDNLGEIVLTASSWKRTQPMLGDIIPLAGDTEEGSLGIRLLDSQKTALTMVLVTLIWV